jgi:DNA-binding CsgD family transcriptional regulator
MKPGRKKHVPLAFPSSEEDTSDESLTFIALQRSNSTSIFYKNDPLTLLLDQEEQELEQEMRDQEIKQAQHLVDQIRVHLSERQLIIWQLRSEQMAFNEIAIALNCSERTVFNEWKAIRQAAWGIIEE